MRFPVCRSTHTSSSARHCINLSAYISTSRRASLPARTPSARIPLYTETTLQARRCLLRLRLRLPRLARGTHKPRLRALQFLRSISIPSTRTPAVPVPIRKRNRTSSNKEIDQEAPFAGPALAPSSSPTSSPFSILLHLAHGIRGEQEGISLEIGTTGEDFAFEEWIAAEAVRRSLQFTSRGNRVRRDSSIGCI